MKKSHFYSLIYSFLLILFILFFGMSCGQDNLKAEYDNEVVLEFKDFFYNSTYNFLMGKNSSSFYVPEPMGALLHQPFIVEGRFYTVFELVFPDKSNIFGLDDYSELYDCHSDNGNWVDRVLFSVEEERIGAELQEMEELINSGIYAPNEESSALEAEKKAETGESGGTGESGNTGGELKEKLPEIKEISKIDGTLGFMEFGKEIFIPIKDGENWIFINAFEEKVTRSFYDSLFRCFCEEKWEINSQGKEEIKKTVKTSYFNDTYQPLVKVITTENSEKNQVFNDKGFLVREENYSVYKEVDSGNNSKTGTRTGVIEKKKKLLQSVMTLKYDGNNKVIESSVTEYNYQDEENSKISYEFNKKYLYKYNSDDIPPDFDYYEEGKLKISNKYKTAGTYTSEIFFNEGFHIKSFYEDGKLIKEVFVTNNSNERTKNYE